MLETFDVRNDYSLRSRCNELMRDRPWDVIEDFHDRVAAGEASPDDLTPLSENDSDHANAEVLDLHEALDDHVASDNGRNGPNGSGATGNGGNPDGYGASGRLEQLRELDGQEGFVQDKSPDFLRSTVQGNGYSYGCGVSVADSGDTNGRRALLESGDPTGFEPFVSRTNWDGCRPSIVSSGETSGRGAFVKSGDSDGLASSNSGKESEVEGPSEGATPISAKSSERRTFKIELAYSGRHFWGWQKQTGHETVQE